MASTDADLETFARFVARATLEIERDLRRPEQLLTLMPHETWEQWQTGRQPGALRGGAVVEADIGRPRIQRLDQRRAIVNVVTRTEPQRWGALSMQLEHSGGRWTIVSLQRLYAGRHYHAGRAQPVGEPIIRQRLAAAEADRRQAAAALEATERRLVELPPGSSGHHETSRLSTTWRKVVADLDREVATLTRRHELGRQAQRSLRRR
jgi:hypothetical protein